MNKDLYIVKNFFRFSVFIAIFLPYKLYSQSLVINEIQASNYSTIADDYGEYSDWIELYNGTVAPINLNGYRLSDNPDNLTKWILPNITIESGGFLLIFASGENHLAGEYLHTNFSISKDGENIILCNPEGVIIDSYSPVGLLSDNSFGRLTDGSNDLVFFKGATPGETNNGAALFVDYTEELIFSHQQGFYTDSFYLNISCSDNDADIYYTLDGSDPNVNSLVYDSPILIYDREDEPNGISTIRTNPESTSDEFKWKEPNGQVFKGTVIKARAFADGQEITPIWTNSYFVDPEMYTRYHGLPVISIITDSLNLFDYNTGIYVPGVTHGENPDWTWHWGTGNYHQTGDEWERPANMSFFESDGSLAFQQNVGIRINGDGSRALPEKSLRVYARSIYGKNSIEYKFFPEKDVTSYKRIILRNGGQDFLTTMLTDAVTHLIVKDVDIESISVRPAVVFLNGEFWGIHNLRDRPDEYYLEYTANADPEHIDYLDNCGSVVEGSNADYMEMIDFIRNNDLSDYSNYQVVEQQIDIENYIDYIIIKQFVAVFDWPGNNISFWKEQVPDAKWRWILFDNDMCLVDYDFDAIEHSTLEGGTAWPNPDASTFLLRNLLKSEVFKQQYLDRFEYHLQTTFDRENTANELENLVNIIEPVMPEHIARWNYPANYGTWVYNVSLISQFFENRPCYMLQHLINHFEIDDNTYASGVCDSINYYDSLEVNNSISLWPNPAEDVINVRLLYTENSKSVISIAIFDMLGRKVQDVPIPESSEFTYFDVKLNNLVSGSYFFVINCQNYSANKMFVIL